MPQQNTILALIKQYHVPAVGIGIIKKGKLKQVQVFGEIEHHSPAPGKYVVQYSFINQPYCIHHNVNTAAKHE